MIERNIESHISIATDLQAMTNPQVIEYLVLTHHEFTRDIMQEIESQIEESKISAPEGANALNKLKILWPDFHKNMTEHLEQEEQILFPAIENPTNDQGNISADGMNAMVLSWLKEHDHHDDELCEIRLLNEKLIAASGGNPTIHELCQNIRQLDLDLHQHMQIESEILFPRVLRRLIRIL